MMPIPADFTTPPPWNLRYQPQIAYSMVPLDNVIKFHFHFFDVAYLETLMQDFIIQLMLKQIFSSF